MSYAIQTHPRVHSLGPFILPLAEGCPRCRVRRGWCLHPSARHAGGSCTHKTHIKPQLCWSHKPWRTWVSDLDFFLSLHCMERTAGLQWALDVLGSVCWGAAQGVSVPIHSAHQEAKAVPARSCGYLLWHKIQISLFVLECEQNLTLT